MTDFTAEEWRPVLRWESLYEVSNFGRVRSLDRQIINKRKNGVQSRYLQKGRLLRIGIFGNGYQYVRLSANGAAQTLLVHRIVALAFLGTPKAPGNHINHKNGNKSDNRPENLEWVTPSENHRHRVHVLGKDNLPKPGDDGYRNPNRASKELEDRIIELRKAGLKLKQIAEILEINGSQVQSCLYRSGVYRIEHPKKQEVLKMLKNSYRVKEIVSQTGVCQKTVNQWAKEASIPTSGRISPQQRAFVLELRERGESTGRIIELSGIARSSVYRILQG